MIEKKKKIFIFDLNIPYLIKDINYPVGGAAVESLNWLIGFKEGGYDIYLMTWKGSKKFIGKETAIDIVETYYPNKGGKKLRFFFYRIPTLYRVLKKHKPDILIQECAGAYTGILSLISKLLGIKFIYRVASDIDVDERIKKTLNFGTYFLFKIGMKQAKIISCQNNYQLQQIKHKYSEKKILKIYNPIKVSYHLKIIEKDQRKYFAWVGNLTYVKNLGALIKIAELNPKVLFKIAGMETVRTDYATKIAISRLKQLLNVEFIGYMKRSGMGDFLSHAFALINTSWFEGFSNTYLEAWSVGTPIITTNNANPDNIIKKFNIGFVSDSYENLPQYVQYIYNMTDLDYHKLVQNCQQYVVNNHDHIKLANSYYKKIF